jgi:SPX domain protein involved in polyphosphate accumulation
MAAECEVEVGTLAKAQSYVNMVRKRAANNDGFVMKGTAPASKYVINTYDMAWTDKALARTAVMFERKLELATEGHRFYDLVRWSMAEKEVNAYLVYESKFLNGTLGGSKFQTGKHELLPIPQGQIDLLGSDILKQNPGY